MKTARSRYHGHRFPPEIISYAVWVYHRNCSTDEGRSLGTGLQEQVPNHLRRLCPKGKVVNAEGKGLELLGQVTGKKRTAREPLLKCRNVIEDVQNRSLVTTVGVAPTIPAYGRSGIRHERWAELAMRQLNGTWEPEIPMLTET